MADLQTASNLSALSGGCLCGAVRYDARPDHRDGYYCHCRMCQLAVGNTRAAWINLRKDQVRWLSEPAHYASSKIAQRSFCSRCGTPLAIAFHDSEFMDLSVGSLDDPSALKPVSHYSVETRISGWHAPDGLPEHRLDTNERIARRWRDAYGDAKPGLDTARGQA